MRLLAAFHNSKLKAPTGGEVYDRHLSAALSEVCEVTMANVRYRWIILKLHPIAWLIRYWKLLAESDWLMQTASSAECSPLLVRLLKLIRPQVRHLGIVHHPRSLENPERAHREKRFYNQFDKLIVISDHIADGLRARGIRPEIRVARPGYDRIVRSPSKESPPMIVWNGHLLPRKGPKILLEALNQMAHKNFQVRFIAATEPDADFAREFRDSLAQLAQRGLDAKLVSRVPREEYERYLCAASAFCLPSTVEGYSIAAVEAMSAGCALIIPRTANFAELMGNDSYAGFFPAGDATALAELLDRVIVDLTFRDRLTKASSERAEQLPSWPDFHRQVAALGRELLFETGNADAR